MAGASAGTGGRFRVVVPYLYDDTVGTHVVVTAHNYYGRYFKPLNAVICDKCEPIIACVGASFSKVCGYERKDYDTAYELSADDVVSRLGGWPFAALDEDGALAPIMADVEFETGAIRETYFGGSNPGIRRVKRIAVFGRYLIVAGLDRSWIVDMETGERYNTVTVTVDGVEYPLPPGFVISAVEAAGLGSEMLPLLAGVGAAVGVGAWLSGAGEWIANAARSVGGALSQLGQRMQAALQRLQGALKWLFAFQALNVANKAITAWENTKTAESLREGARALHDAADTVRRWCIEYCREHPEDPACATWCPRAVYNIAAAAQKMTNLAMDISGADRNPAAPYMGILQEILEWAKPFIMTLFTMWLLLELIRAMFRR